MSMRRLLVAFLIAAAWLALAAWLAVGILGLGAGWWS